MATYNKFEQFIEDLAQGEHDFGADTFKVALTVASPSVSADAVLADITEISYANLDTQTLASPTTNAQTSGTYTLLWPDFTMTASGTVASFQYVTIYNSTALSLTNPLVCYFDYGSSLTLESGETLTLNWTTSSFTLDA